MLNFAVGTKHIITFYVSPPHWYDRGSWNLSSSKTRSCIFYSQYHECWCSGSLRRHGISNHDIYYVEPDYFSPCTLRVNIVLLFIILKPKQNGRHFAYVIVKFTILWKSLYFYSMDDSKKLARITRHCFTNSLGTDKPLHRWMMV